MVYLCNSEARQYWEAAEETLLCRMCQSAYDSPEHIHFPSITSRIALCD